MKIKAANGVARILKAEGVPWVSCYPTNHVNNALGEEGVRILMMGEERFAVAVADAYSRVNCGRKIGVCTVMSNLNAAGIQMAYGAIAQAWEDSSPMLVITEGVGQGASRHTHFDIAEALAKQGFEVAKSAIRMPQGPLKTVGDHPLKVALHTDVVVTVTVSVVAEQ